MIQTQVWRPNGRGFEPHQPYCVVSLSKNINPCLVLFKSRKTTISHIHMRSSHYAHITEKLLMGRKESNQTSKQNQNKWVSGLFLLFSGKITGLIYLIICLTEDIYNIHEKFYTLSIVQLFHIKNCTLVSLECKRFFPDGPPL